MYAFPLEQPLRLGGRNFCLAILFVFARPSNIEIEVNVNSDRFQDNFCSIAQFGIQKNGGVTRLAFSREDMDARNFLIEAMRCARLQVSIDPIGNIHGLRTGTDPSLAPVMIGSHLDTVPDGGHYDGVVGVLAALEVVSTLNDLEIETQRSIEIVNFSAEESSRFGMATIGSKAITGKIEQSDLTTLIDNNGESLHSVLSKAGQSLDDLPNSTLTTSSLHAYLELHIEQGPVLENKEINIGIVTDIAAPTRFKVKIIGRSDHSGNTPMDMRQDALAGAAEIVLAVEQLTTNGGADTVGTVGELNVHPGAMNVIPGQVELSIDIRDTNLGDKNKVVQQLKQRLNTIAKTRQLEIIITPICDDTPVKLSEQIASRLSHHATKLGLSYLTMPSGAGHDAMHFAPIVPTGLIFIPSIQGISHNPEEKSTMTDIINGTELLFSIVKELATSTS
ncbi:MAG: Zn-dependent hydrolase [Deltaproteobacteria bacterium]|nr:Zn-dependent hydrolase [Deltaproteobacteria bacterium]